MNRTPRALAAVVAATALMFTGVHAADAKPAQAGSHVKAEKSAKAKAGKSDAATRLARDVERVKARLDGTVSAQRLAKLDSADADAVVANVEADKLLLDGVTDRAELRTFRVENYRLVVNVLRKAAKVRSLAEGNAEAGALVESAVAKALDVTATDSKAEVKAARADLVAALGLLEGEDATEDGVEETDGGNVTEGTDGGETVDGTEGGENLSA